MADPDAMAQFEAAIVARLGATATAISTDPQLASLLPGGVHSRSGVGDIFPFLGIGLIRMDEDSTWGRTYRYRFTYGVTANDESEALEAASAALHRVYELLQNSGGNLTMEDFTCDFIRRRGRTHVAPSRDGVTWQRITDEWRADVYPKV